ncbi:MAG: hypothetical protein AAF393_01170 [Pseudomonadota bacterium]
MLIWGGLASAFLAANPLDIPGLPNGLAAFTGGTSISDGGSKWASARSSFSGFANVSSWGGPKVRSLSRGSTSGSVHSIVSASEAELARKRGLSSSGAKFVSH